MRTYTMISKFYFICLLYFGLYPMIVHSYGDFELLNDDNNGNVIDKIRSEKLSKDSIKLHRVKRSGPSGTTFINYPPVSFTSMPTLPRSPTPPRSPSPSPTSAMMSTQSAISSRYIITSYATQVPTAQTTHFTSQSTPTITSGIITGTRAAPMSSTSSPYNPDTCGIVNYIRLFNNTCVSKPDAQIFASGILLNNSNNATYTANALSLYISSITNSTVLLNTSNTLSVGQIDNVVNNLTGVNLIINSNTSLVMIQQPNKDDNIMILGASFIRGIGGEVIDTTNKDNVTRLFLSAAAIVSQESLDGVLFLNILIVDKPTGYETADNSTNKTLASSVIVANVQRNSSTVYPISISLYFKPLDEYHQNGSGKYLCAFYDTNTLGWSDYGCTDALYNIAFDRYECSCNHTTSFALVWLPESLLTATNTKQLDAQDIASLIFQCISIICFLSIMIHAIGVRIINPLMSVQARNLLPLISTGSTTILFIFYIALGLTAYTQTSSSDQTECFLSSSILMFSTYFFLIFMFCVKTSAGYFYYLRFVRLFPYPSYQRLSMMLIISFLISSLSVAFAIGFNASSSYYITHLYPYELCWFTPNVIYYFMTIPIGIFIIMNIITIILVSKSILTHARNAATSRQIQERLKRCVIILLSSCVTQGIGWIFGPFISFVSTTAGNVFGWIFIVLNGLEGVWSILLYLLIRSQRIDEQKHVSAAIDLSKSTGIRLSKNKKNDQRRNAVQVTQKNIGKIRPFVTNDLRQREMMDISSNENKVPH